MTRPGPTASCSFCCYLLAFKGKYGGLSYTCSGLGGNISWQNWSNNTKQSQEDGMTQILRLGCTLEHAAVICIVACWAHHVLDRIFSWETTKGSQGWIDVSGNISVSMTDLMPNCIPFHYQSSHFQKLDLIFWDYGNTWSMCCEGSSL